MAQYDHYTAKQLFESIETSDASTRSYLIRLLLQKRDGRDYIERLLSTDDLVKDVLRLISPADASRFAKMIGRLLEQSNVKTKKIIISRLEGTKDPSLITALLGRVEDNAEDPSVRRMAITTLGNSGANQAVATLIQEFDHQDADGKTEILIALNKIAPREATELFKRALHDPSETVRSMAEKALRKAGNGMGDLQRPSPRTDIKGDYRLYRSWTRDPASYPDTSQLSFFNNGTGYYEEAKAGEVELSIEFHFRVLDGTIVFLFGSDSERSTGFTITESQFTLPYDGQRKCEVLKFFRNDIRVKGIDITATDYYYLFETE